MGDDISRSLIGLLKEFFRGVLQMSARGFMFASNKIITRIKNPHGKMSVRRLAGKDQGMSTIDIPAKNFKTFNKIIASYHIDFSFKINRQNRNEYTVFFKPRDADVMEKIMAEYTAETVGYDKHKNESKNENERDQSKDERQQQKQQEKDEKQHQADEKRQDAEEKPEDRKNRQAEDRRQPNNGKKKSAQDKTRTEQNTTSKGRVAAAVGGAAAGAAVVAVSAEIHRRNTINQKVNAMADSTGEKASVIDQLNAFSQQVAELKQQPKVYVKAKAEPSL